MEDQTKIKTDTPVIDATGDTDIPANAGKPDPNVVPAGPAATSFADAVTSFGGLNVKAPVEASPDEPAEAVEEECGTVSKEALSSLTAEPETQESWKRGELREGGFNVSTERGTIFYIATPHHKALSQDDVRWFEFQITAATDDSTLYVIKHHLTGDLLYHVSNLFELLDLPDANDDEADVAKEDISASLEDDAIEAADDQDAPEPETLQTAETTDQDFNALMFRTAALNAAASICQGTGASSYEVTAKAEDLMVWLQGEAGSADFEEPRD
jgi:hypothetical protein